MVETGQVARYKLLSGITATRPISVSLTLVFLWIIWGLFFFIILDHVDCVSSLRPASIVCATISGASTWSFFLLWIVSVYAAVKLVDAAEKQRWLGIVCIIVTVIFPPLGLLMAGLRRKLI